MRLLAILMVAGVMACTGTPSLVPVAVSTIPPQRLQGSVALVIPAASRTLTVSEPNSGDCLGERMEADFGGAFSRTMSERLKLMFPSVTEIDSASQASPYGVVFIAELSSVSFRLGCVHVGTAEAQVTGGLRALDSQGREIWRSDIRTRRSEVELFGIDTNRKLGLAASRALALLVEDWLREAGGPAAGRLAAALAPPSTVSSARPGSRLAHLPVVNRFPKGEDRPDDVAVIIGNADYSRLGRNIPDALPAHADAEGARLYALQALGIREGNVIMLQDATGAQMTRVFGSERDHRGQLSDWVKPGKSRVFVFYSGHGAPAGRGGSPFLIPADADAGRIELNGYALAQLYDNLGRLPAASVTVVLEACFSGVSPAGAVVAKASPVFMEARTMTVPAHVTVIAAASGTQMASWEQDDSSGLFTKYFLTAMAGEADADKDGVVSLEELERYLDRTLTYQARRLYGRDQNAQIVRGGTGN